MLLFFLFLFYNNIIVVCVLCVESATSLSVSNLQSPYEGTDC